MAELVAWRAAVEGPPASFAVDDTHLVVTGSWRCLLGLLPRTRWESPLLHDLLSEADADWLDDRLDDPDDGLTLADLRQVAHGLVEAATGWRWWVAQRLYASVAADWVVLDAMLTRQGGDLVALADQPARLCALMYGLCVDGLAKKDREMFDFKLNKPPPGVRVREVEVMSAEQQSSAFMAAMGNLGQVGGGGPGRAGR